ncbi:MAG: 2-oxoglutarate dehydrogenase, E2 component, dihydrolipoamide succinyltransferase [Rhodothermaceae bacterium]|nr:2-oxoglutarate dehydrogenase, E2 component, dihydrolipoamide succinyltransferase [Rhodothermaceae bacterium]
MAKIEVKMPQMGESITEGTVIVWLKKPGDQVELDETLLEIGTDKVDTEVPSPAKGVLAEIVVPEGETVDVGVTIAILETDVEAVSVPSSVDVPPQEQPAEPVQAAPSAPEPAAAPISGDGGERAVVVMPKMGESITEGTVIAWHKKVGESIALDETLLEIGTDKVDTEVPSPAAGVLLEILVPEGDTVDVGVEIAVIGQGVGAAAVSKSPASSPSAPVAQPSISVPSKEVVTESAGDGVLPVAPSTEPVQIPRRGSDGQFFSPLVRSIAEKEGIPVEELAAISGSGRDGRITKGDVLGYIENRKKGGAPVPQPASFSAAVPAPPIMESSGRVEIVEMDRMRQIIAEHMVRSKATSAHVTSFAEVDVTNLVKVRERNKAAFQAREGIKLSYTPFMVHAAVKALREHPYVNASVQEKKILVKKDYHVGIAVAIDKSRLVVPVIRNAGQLNLAGVAHAAADLADRARNKRLQPNDLQGGTFTVTNIGSIGSLMGTPIINQPQVAILATGAIKKKPVVLEDPNLGDIIAIRHMMFISLSYDHRIIDGAMAASFLQQYVSILESIQPDMLV